MFQFLRGFVPVAALVLNNGSVIGQQLDVRRTANYMMPACRDFAFDTNNTDAFTRGWCFGIVDALRYADKNSCVPDAATGAQLIRVVVQYIDQRPARLHESFKELATEALRATWPCKN
jgi:Rap1a immunity proteins